MRDFSEVIVHFTFSHLRRLRRRQPRGLQAAPRRAAGGAHQGHRGLHPQLGGQARQEDPRVGAVRDGRGAPHRSLRQRARGQEHVVPGELQGRGQHPGCWRTGAWAGSPPIRAVLLIVGGAVAEGPAGCLFEYFSCGLGLEIKPRAQHVPSNTRIFIFPLAKTTFCEFYQACLALNSPYQPLR